MRAWSMGSLRLHSPLSSWRQQGILCSPALAGDPHPPRDASPSGSSFHALGIFMQWVEIPGGFGGAQVPTGRWEMLGSRQGWVSGGGAEPLCQQRKVSR